MSKKEERNFLSAKRKQEKKRRKNIKAPDMKALDILESYPEELKENLNLKLLCDRDFGMSAQEQILWVESITVTELWFNLKSKSKHYLWQRVITKIKNMWKRKEERRD